MQVIVTSYRRLKYLRQCIESLRLGPDVEVYVADGGSDEETIEYIKSAANGWILFKDNPGADWLKTEGIKTFVSDPEFVVTSDDIVFPNDWSRVLLRNYMLINTNPDRPEYTFCACNYESAEEVGIRTHGWVRINGVECLPTLVSQVLGAIMNTQVCRDVGYFPNYGQSGQGDWAMNKRLEKRGIKRCYFREPMCRHIGSAKLTDFPEYSKEFRADEDHWQQFAQMDNGVLYTPKSPDPWEVGRRNVRQG